MSVEFWTKSGGLRWWNNLSKPTQYFEMQNVSWVVLCDRLGVHLNINHRSLRHSHDTETLVTVECTDGFVNHFLWFSARGKLWNITIGWIVAICKINASWNARNVLLLFCMKFTSFCGQYGARQTYLVVYIIIRTRSGFLNLDIKYFGLESFISQVIQTDSGRRHIINILVWMASGLFCG